jgi:hypothetical protein
VAGYTVYRNGAAVGTVGPAATSFLDIGVAAGTSYTYALDAFNLAGQHSSRSTAVAVGTPAGAPTFVQGGAMSPGTRQASVTLTLAQPVVAGDLLVGWFGQFNTAGQVQVSDDVNGLWKRSVSEGFSSGSGDIAIYYAQSLSAPSGLTVTVTDPAGPAYLQFAMADFRGAMNSWTLDQAFVSEATTGSPNVGPTGTVPAGELVVASVLTGGQPGWTAPGSDSQRVPYLVDAHNGSTSSDLEDILSGAAGPQQAGFTLGSGSDWYMMIATFRTTPPPTWVSLGGSFGSGPAVASWAPNRMDVFAADSAAGTIWHRAWNGTGWFDWQNLGGIAAAAGTGPAAVSWGPNRVDVFVRGLDNQLWHMWWNGTSWQGWEPLGGVLTSSPTVSSWGSGRLDVFARGQDGAIWHRAFAGSWYDWQSVGGFATSAPAATSWGSGRIDFFVRGGDNGLWHQWWDGRAWSGWQSLGGAIASAPSVSSWGVGRLDLVALDGSGTPNHMDWGANRWSSWSPLGGTGVGDPAIVDLAPGSSRAFVRGQDSTVWYAPVPS